MSEIALIDWLKQRRTINCPNHGFKIPPSWSKNTCWCPICKQIWRMQDDTRAKGRPYRWWYCNDEGKFAKSGGRGIDRQ